MIEPLDVFNHMYMYVHTLQEFNLAFLCPLFFFLFLPFVLYSCLPLDVYICKSLFAAFGLVFFPFLSLSKKD